MESLFNSSGNRLEAAVDPAATAGVGTFTFSEMRIPLALPAPRASGHLAPDRVIGRIIEKCEQYGAREALLFARGDDVLAYFSGRSEPLVFESRWSDILFVAERSSVSIHRDSAIIAVVDLQSIRSFLPGLGEGADFISRNPDLDSRAILVVPREAQG